MRAVPPWLVCALLSMANLPCCYLWLLLAPFNAASSNVARSSAEKSSVFPMRRRLAVYVLKTVLG